MKNLKFIVLLLAVITMYSCNNVPKETIIEVDDAGENGGRLLLDILETSIELERDKEGIAKVNLDMIDEPCLALVHIGSVVKYIYIEPGDYVKVKIGEKREFSYDGDQSAVNAFLLERVPMGINSEDYDGSIADFKKAFDKAIEGYSELIASKPELKDAASVLIQNRIYTIWRVAIIKYTERNDHLSKEELAFILQFLQTQNATAFNCRNSIDAIDRGIKLLGLHGFNKSSRDIQWDEGTESKLNWLDNNITDTDIKQHFTHSMMMQYLTYNGVDKGKDFYKYYRETVTKKAFLDEFNTKFDELNKIQKGRVCPDFKYIDVNGEQRSFEEFKGKYIYIDLWATWCGKCVAQFPYLKELKEKYKNNNIAFVGLNNDRTHAIMINYMKENNMHGEQWYLGQNTEFYDFFNIVGQPRFILLDREGKIYDSYMPRADQMDQITSYFDQLEGI
ncbi:TlpA family protein disulfide reductase [Carboxylicivirga marina]|uniref:TlpA family protein disulfide reductase n=1 Tax=Carboxylicivirga marina TaxID=2800988 RepID=A0ABS1HKJ5_9BACT|nr:TlpA disulfide reductase family protein [Carboxylicivirga marina]MBK3518199.1 TlpA family protein disulfide reductase [Carboxylicivirga marina]